MSLSPKRVRELLSYDPGTGEFRWRVDRGHVKAGDRAGALRDGRWVIMIDGHNHQAGRLAWAHVHGEWPPAQVDHRSRDPLDNKIKNLRPATQTLNNANRGKPKGANRYRGAYLKRGKRWYAKIKAGNKQIYLGIFDTDVDAAKAYDAAAKVHFGEFAMLNFSDGQCAS